MLSIITGQADKLRAQRHQGNQIWNGHQAVDNLRKDPDGAGAGYGTQDYRGSLEQGKLLPGIVAKQKLSTSGTVKAPAQNRGEGKAAEKQGKQNADPIPVNRGKGSAGQLYTGIRSIGDDNTAAQNHQRRHRTDDDGIEKHLHDTHQALIRRMLHLSGGVGDGRGAHAGLVGKDTPGYAHPQGPED